VLKFYFVYQFEEFETFVISFYFFNGQPSQAHFRIIDLDCEFHKFFYDSEVQSPVKQYA